MQTAKIHMDFDLDAIERFCQSRQVVLLGFYGPVLQRELEPDEEVGVAYKYDPSYSPGWEFAVDYDRIAEVIGRPAHVVTIGGLRNAARRFPHRPFPDIEYVYRAEGFDGKA